VVLEGSGFGDTCPNAEAILIRIKSRAAHPVANTAAPKTITVASTKYRSISASKKPQALILKL
jgi:hypothetical protein